MPVDLKLTPMGTLPNLINFDAFELVRLGYRLAGDRNAVKPLKTIGFIRFFEVSVTWKVLV